MSRARTTRDRKDHEQLSELMGRWQAELAAAGFPPAVLSQMVGEAGRSYQPPEIDLHGLAGELLAPGGRLASEKTFDRAAVIVAVAPHLHGLPVSMLDDAVDAVLAHRDAVRLPAVGGAREETWAAACVLTDEQSVAALVDKLAATGRAARVDRGKEGEAIAAVEASLGRPLTAAQREVVEGLLSSGHGLDLVVGVAG